ncbi:MAG TPA: SusC/RagA family TonB-linked outer membrane protein, partial [Cytophagales bacterium]|nr:SusC/RagA family TonB-linked outer membrane protein [Cytophagales bacterium]
SGSVKDATGATVPGVNVVVVGSGSGVITDLDGNYRIEVSGDDAVLRFSFIGYATQELNVGSRSVIDVTLEEDTQIIDEVVIVGYNTVKRGDLTSSVSTISGDDIKAQPIGSIDNLLQGKSTGMLVTSQNGRPGGQAYIRIRGIGSVNASNEPLFIIDGVQMTQSDYNALDPNDVENISILKDAASTSIYGARASNGVILITTKRGQAGRPRISYSFQYGQKSLVPLPFEVMNKAQKLEYEVALGLRSQDSADELMDDPSAPETDWVDILTRQGIVQSHDASISGGNDVSKYYVSIGNYSEQGISVGSQFDRLNGRLNFEFQSTDWLKFGNTLNISRTNEQELRDRNNVQNPFRAMYTYNPFEPEFELDDEGNQITDENGDPIYNLTRQGFSISEAILNNPETSQRTHIIGTLFAEASPIEGLTLKSTIGSNYQIYRREYYIYPGSVLDGYVGDPLAPGIKTDNGFDRFINTWTNIGTYNRTFGGQHNVSILAGTEFLGFDIQRYSISGKGFPSSDFSTQDNASEITGGNTSRDQYNIWSQFGRVSYNLGEKYFADFSLRRDGSSRFGDNAKYGLFWAASAGWNLHEESFMSGISAINQLKPRFAIGTSGNVPGDNLGFYVARGLYGFGAYNNQSAAVPTQLANPDLQWEENFNYSIGLDFAFLNSRISGAFDYYNRTTTNLLFSRPLSQTVGFTSRLENVGSFRNQGIELELRGDVIRRNDLSLQLFGSISTNANEVLSLDNGGEDIISSFTVLREGLPINNYFQVRYAGTNPANGEKLYLDSAGQVTNVYSSDFAVALEGKSPLPTYFGNFGFNLDYKGLTLATNFYYQGGNYIFNIMEQVLLSDGANARQNQMVDAFNYWQEPGDTGVLPAPDITSNNDASDRFIQRGDFIRLRNLQLGYSLPRTWIEPIKMQQAQVYVQGTNLWTFNPYYNGDPEVGRGSEESNLTALGETNLFTFPNARGITFGVNVSF